ncbi:MAG: cytochrome c-type biogenesis CcmF C-terminal domain-containing protein [Ardenticatenaceae bacterium]|nr:cytochrome c-type biogenesis CcmF C-terminal domain-containing protein [Ardenticatenaceae bacterium]
MLAEFGQSAIWCALLAAIYSIAAAGFSVYRQKTDQISGQKWLSSARNAALITFPLLLIACAIMVMALITDDYSIAYVQQVTSRETPLVLKITSLWGGQQGSLLLWSLLLSGFLGVAWITKWNEKSLMPYALIIGGFTQVFFTYLIAFPENPFEAAPFLAANGSGLSPLLRHPLMIIHPPMLYLGYTGFIVPYAFAMGALMTGRLDDGWIRTTRRWTLAAWLFLSLGLILGGRWAYDVLGWGGYWEWDPVENVAFLPWLTGTAFLHSVMIQEKRGMFKVWNVVLILITYLLVIYGTLIVRTGLLSSVHAFAQSDIQWVFFGFMVFMLLFSAGWAIYRAPALASNNHLGSLLSRESAFLINNFVIMAITLIIFFFTNFTLLSELFTGQEYGVGPQQYNLATGPLFALLLLLMGVAPLTMWYRTSINHLGRLSLWPAAVATLLVIGIVIAGITQIGALIGLWIVFFSTGLTTLEYVRAARARRRSKDESWPTALGQLFVRNQRRYGGYLIHLGVLVMAFGIIGSEFFQADRQIFLQSGQRASLRDYTIEFVQADFYMENDVQVAQATVNVYDEDGSFITTLFPHTDIFGNGEGMTIPDARSTIAEDFYVILVNWEGVQRNAATLRMYINPLINWLWAGGVVFMIGTLIAAWPDPLDMKIAEAERRRVAVLAAGD